MKAVYVLRPNEQRPDWPKEKREADQLRAEAKLQRTIPYYGHPYDHNLDWREMVREVSNFLQTVVTRADGVVERTFPWRDPADLRLLQDGFPIRVTPKVTPGPWDAMHFRYVYVTWEIEVVLYDRER